MGDIIGYAVAMFGGGHLYAALGGPGMYMVVGITSVVIFILHLISLRLLPPPPEGLYTSHSIFLLTSSSKADEVFN